MNGHATGTCYFPALLYAKVKDVSENQLLIAPSIVTCQQISVWFIPLQF